MHIWLCFREEDDHLLLHAEESTEEGPGEPPFSNDTGIIQHCFKVIWKGQVPILARVDP